MGLVPVYLCFSHRAIYEPDGGEPFQLPLVTPTEQLGQNRQIADTMPGRDRFYVPYLAKNSELHRPNVSRLKASRTDALIRCLS